MQEECLIQAGECSNEGEGSMINEDEAGAVLEEMKGAMLEGGEGLMFDEAGAMQLEMVTPTSSTISTGASGGDGDNTGMASILDLMADSLAFTLDRKVDMELALLEDLLASLRKERLKLEEDAERLAVNLPSTALLDDIIRCAKKT